MSDAYEDKVHELVRQGLADIERHLEWVARMLYSGRHIRDELTPPPSRPGQAGS